MNHRICSEQAMQLLADKYGWQRHAPKHHESRFTRFYEGYWLPATFGFDSRRAHFSSLILTGQSARGEALERIAWQAYDEQTIAQHFEYIATKLGISADNLRGLFAGVNRSFRDYATTMGIIGLGTAMLRAVGVQRAIIR